MGVRSSPFFVSAISLEVPGILEGNQLLPLAPRDSHSGADTVRVLGTCDFFLEIFKIILYLKG